ncbi:MAG: phosphoribosylformylglycinamidine cyclo-ligase [Rhodothermaceae bacterium]|nr:phosphoribosylformylglycinamidine cyclo-ligase [Rhodothermaceae bacterium]
MSKKEFTYKDAGVDIQAGEKLVESIKDMVKQTHTPGVLTNIGGFGGLFRPDFTGYRDPVLVSSVDGVGTKLKVAFMAGKYDTVGQDLVNHCVNDIAVCGAEPLFFLDYFSTGKLEQNVAFDVIKGFTIACRENDCALIGGETAEMPDLYKAGEFDLAGTVVGVVDRSEIIDGRDVGEGDILVGFRSSGLHTNGYSLARKVLFSNYKVDEFVDDLGKTVGEALLAVHRSYLGIIRKLKSLDGIKALSHITGGGIIGNTKRVTPDGFELDIDWGSWDRPAIFDLIKKTGNVPEEDMRKTFNLGIGLIAITDQHRVHDIRELLAEENEMVYEIGRVVRKQENEKG